LAHFLVHGWLAKPAPSEPIEQGVSISFTGNSHAYGFDINGIELKRHYFLIFCMYYNKIYSNRHATKKLVFIGKMIGNFCFGF
jgi:hypothetical protein